MIVPLADRVVVSPLEPEDVTPGGVVLPADAQEKPQWGNVVAVGPGAHNDRGVRVSTDINPGDTVVFTRYGGVEVTIDGVDYLILRAGDILGIAP